MPTGLDHDNRGARLKPRVGDRLKPCRQPLPLGRAVSLLAALYRVIDQEQVGTAARDGPARTDRVVSAAGSQVKPVDGVAVVAVHALRKDGAVQGLGYEVADAAAE